MSICRTVPFFVVGKYTSICHTVPWCISHDNEPAARHKAQGLRKSVDSDFSGLKRTIDSDFA